MIIAIDGPAGSGKSTVARAIAKRCGLTYLDTGAMYRCVTLACLLRGVDIDDAAEVARLANEISIDFKQTDDGQIVLLDLQDVSADIRTAEVEHRVSEVAAIPEVRAAMVALQRAAGEHGNVVAEGRDIGTVVYPDAQVKVFLTASAAARAHRRAVQREGGDVAQDAEATADAAKEQAILAEIMRRDKIDSSRKADPLRPADDACHIDSSNMTLDEVVDAIVKLMEEAGAE